MAEVCGYTRIVKSVVRSLRAKGLQWWADPEDLESVGVLALLEYKGATPGWITKEPALAHTVARNAILSAIRKESVRQRDRVDDAPMEDGDGTLIDNVDWPSEAGDDRKELIWKLARILNPHVYEIMVLRFSVWV